MKALDERIYFVANKKHWSLRQARASPELWKAFLSDELGLSLKGQGDSEIDQWQLIQWLFWLGKLRVWRVEHYLEECFVLVPVKHFLVKRTHERRNHVHRKKRYPSGLSYRTRQKGDS